MRDVRFGQRVFVLFWLDFSVGLKSIWRFSSILAQISFAMIICSEEISFYESSLLRASGSSRSIGGGDVNTSTFLLGPCVKYPAVGATPD